MSLTDNQLKVTELFDARLAVAAGAGSGKTHTLQHRVLNAFAENVIDDIEQVLAITFTDAAAAELKSRIRGMLRTTPPFDVQALGVDRAWISTIHGMCVRVLREHALELNIDPFFAQVPEEEKARLYNEAHDAVIGCLPTELDDAINAISFKTDDMVKSLVEIMEASPLGKDAVQVLRFPPAEQLLSEADKRLREARVYNPSWEPEEVQAAHERIKSAIDAGDVTDLQAAELILGIPYYERLNTLMNNRFKEHDADKEAFYDAYDSILEIVLQARLNLSRIHLNTIIELAGLIFDEYQSRKRRLGYVKFKEKKNNKGPPTGGCLRK